MIDCPECELEVECLEAHLIVQHRYTREEANRELDYQIAYNRELRPKMPWGGFSEP